MEQQILALHDQGYNYNQIANSLGCSRATVRYHIEPKAKENTKLRVELQRAKKKKEKMKLKENFVIKPSLKLLKKEQPKIEVKEKQKKPKRAKKEKESLTALDPRKRVFKSKPLNLKEKIAVNLGDAKNTIVYTSDKKYKLKDLQLKYLGKSL